jgi:hypothetical protein
VEPVVEILAKPSLGDGLLEIGVGRHDQAHVDGDRSACPDPDDLVLLQHSQKLHLRGERQIGDLVEEEGSSIGSLEPPRLACERAGECTFLVPE